METKDQSSQSGHQPSTSSISNSDSSSGAMRYRSNSHLTEDAATPSPNINEEDQYDYHSIDSTPAEDAEDQIHLSLDEESEEVKQAVLALGAMRRLDLDGSSTASSSPRPKFTSNTSEDAQMDDRSGNDGASLTGSAISSSSAVSSASSTSTPATSQFTSDSGPHHQSRKSTQPPTFTRAQNYAQIHSNSRRGHLGGNSGVGRTGGSFGLQSEEPPSSSASTSTSADDSDFVAGSSTNQTDLDQSTRIIKDLPEDFQLPSTIQDENGNEIKIDKEMMKDEAFLRRISHLPIVRSTLRAYEMGKQSSRVVKYGADFVESSVKSISRPVVSRLGASLGDKGVEQLDDFACRQLDRIYPSASMERSISKDEKATIMEELDERSRTDWKDMSSDEISKRRNAYWSLRLEEKEREMVVNELRQRKGKGKERSRADTEMSESSQSSGGRWIQDTTDNDGAGFVGPGGGGGSSSSSKGPGQVVRAADGLRAARSNVSMPGPAANGSRWGSMLVEAGMTAGGLTAAMSEESMKSLKYCLQWLQYATAHIEYQITILRDLIVKLNHGELEISAEATERLNNVKGDVLGTIDNVVKVIGNYAGLALPEQARETVKVFILSIPGRWNAMNQTPTTGPGAAAGARVANFGGSPVSPSFSPAHLSAGLSSSSSSSGGSSHSPIHGSSAQQHRMAAAIAAQGANKILTLAVESLDVLRSVTVVFGESLDRADLWVERLRVLGLQRKRQHEQAALQEAGEDDGMEDEYGNRIESASPPHWGAGGHPDSRAERGMSPGAESNVSEGTSKRRRVKSSRKNSSASQGGSSTPNLTFSPSSTRRSSASNSEQPEEEETLFHQGTTTISSTLNDGAFSSSRSSYGHPHSGTSQATRRNRHQHRQSTSRPSSAAHTPNFSYTPLPSEMQRNFSSHSGGGR